MGTNWTNENYIWSHDVDINIVIKEVRKLYNVWKQENEDMMAGDDFETWYSNGKGKKLYGLIITGSLQKCLRNEYKAPKRDGAVA